MDEHFRDEASGRYVLVLNPRMKVMLGWEGWTKIDWGRREVLTLKENQTMACF